MPAQARREREAGEAPRRSTGCGMEEMPERRKTERRRRNRTSQGLMRKFRNLQGPLGKVKFHINLKL
jgi:hypothetical protein